ncbi:outer membrane protein OmpW [Alteromonas sediminis]|uniref:Outer membrane protein OmpW n=1 Tax=Alteromonas sediminis TaxID=2259342 RepID=A0A3N5Y4L3_9ALTE|nr:OmpW family outer membrane protein [Alteromonas sediminis]RPJ68083.1 outer membrane protein OmpW [Alteromonas sediminis]
MNTFKKRYISALLAASFTVAPFAQAFQEGDILVRAGLATVVPDDATSNVFVGSDLGFGLSVDNNTQLGLTFAYFFKDNWNVEVLAATPFKHDVNFAVADPLGTGNQLGEVTHLPPTVTVNYYFMGSTSAFQPYVGAGINYTIFFDEEFTDTNSGAGLQDLSLDDSLGLAFQLGADYKIDKTWFINGAIRWIDIDTQAEFNLSGTPGRVDDIQIDPMVYTLSVGYRF